MNSKLLMKQWNKYVFKSNSFYLNRIKKNSVRMWGGHKIPGTFAPSHSTKMIKNVYCLEVKTKFYIETWGFWRSFPKKCYNKVGNRSRILYECEDWNMNLSSKLPDLTAVVLYMSARIEITHLFNMEYCSNSRTLHECVNWNIWSSVNFCVVMSHSIWVRELKFCGVGYFL